MDFLDKFSKEIEKVEGIAGSSKPPAYWFSTGNYVVNKILGGSFHRGIPQGRVTGLAGPSGAGKSFVAGNIIKNAQDDGAFILVVDSENALDDEFMRKIGVDVENKYMYKSVTTIPHVTKIVSGFLKGYKSEYDGDAEDPKILIVIDSLDMLMTETELEHYAKGNQKGDQGQRNKQLKAMLRTFVQDIKSHNISIVCTSQVYKNQDVMNGEGVWIVSDAVKYSLSQIALLTKLKLKGDDREVTGIKMKVESYKTRFSKPFQTVTCEVPYDTGMDPYSGLLEAVIAAGLVQQKGAWYQIKDTDTKFQRKNFADYAEEFLEELETDDAFLQVSDAIAQSVIEEQVTETKKETAARRKEKANGGAAEELSSTSIN
jgi:RecA/RadA recombinase